MLRNDAKNYLSLELQAHCSAYDASSLADEFTDEYIQDLQDDVQMGLQKLAFLRGELRAVEAELSTYLSLLSSESIETPTFLMRQSEQSLKEIDARIERYEEELSTLFLRIDSWRERESIIYTMNTDVMRSIMADIAAVRVRFEWRAPAIGMSRYISAFSPRNLNSPTHNYQRSGYPYLLDLEERLQRLWYPTKQLELTSYLVSSGMAGYTVVEDHLMKRVIAPGDVVLTAPYIYFENMEQLKSHKHISLVVSPSYEVEVLVDLIKRHKPKAVFLDLMANITELSMVDIKQFFSALAQQDIGHTVVIFDNTVTPTLNPFALWEEVFGANPPAGLDLIVLESCNKYRQHGLDVCMAGLVTTITNSPAKHKSLLDSRRHTGGVLTDYAAHAFPKFPVEFLRRRMQRTERNCRVFAKTINAVCGVKCGSLASHPSLPSFSDREICEKYNVPTGLVTFPITVTNVDSTEWLGRLIKITMTAARRHRVSLTNGLSFGFDTTRISVAARPAVEVPSFLRIAGGTENVLNALKLSLIMKRAFDEVTAFPGCPIPRLPGLESNFAVATAA
jgi:cystathionine beta-lyase/cystathionine gamma-synthase